MLGTPEAMLRVIYWTIDYCLLQASTRFFAIIGAVGRPSSLGEMVVPANIRQKARQDTATNVSHIIQNSPEGR